MNRKRRVGVFGARENYPKVDERESQRERWILESRVEATDACAFDILHGSQPGPPSQTYASLLHYFLPQGWANLHHFDFTNWAVPHNGLS